MEYVRYYALGDDEKDSIYSPIESDKDIALKIEHNGKEYVLSKYDGEVIRHIYPEYIIETLKKRNLIVDGRI